MKYTKGGFPFKTDPKKKAKKSTTTAHGQLNDAQIEYEEDKKALSTNIKTPKAMKDGPKNRVHGAGNTGNWKNPHAVKPKPSQDIYSDLEKYDDDK